MGELEKTSKERAKKQNIQKAVLGIIYAAGFLSIAVVAPNVVKSLEKFIPKDKRVGTKYSANRSLSQLIERGLVNLEKTPTGTFVQLTKKGEQALSSMDLNKIHAYQSKKKWDRKWRVVIFDIKEKRRVLRDKLRRTLIEIGFIKLQNSVWVYPYDVEDLVKMLKADFKIGKDVLYMIVDQIENDTSIRRHFSLK